MSGASVSGGACSRAFPTPPPPCSYGLDANEILDNVLIARALTHEAQAEMITAVKETITSADAPYRLLVIDSVMATFRTEFSGRGELSERQQLLSSHLRDLVKLASEFNLAVVLTNQVCAGEERWEGGGGGGLTSHLRAMGPHPPPSRPRQHVRAGRQETRGRPRARAPGAHARVPEKGACVGEGA